MSKKGIIFEYDDHKSAANKLKHGLDFEQARALWEDPMLLEIVLTSGDEPRYMVIGELDSRVWAGIITYRIGNVRLISVRRARKDEKKDYYSQRTR